MAVLKYKDPVTGEWVAASGPPGEPGPVGPAGADGYTPVKGTDYWTEADKAEIVNSIDLDALGAVSKDLSNVTGILGAANGGTGVTSLAALKTALGISGGVQVATGTYNGNGSTSFTINFSFAPRFLMISGNDYNAYYVVSYIYTSFGGTVSRSALPASSTSFYSVKSVLSGNSVTITGTGATEACNKSGITYSYTAFG